MKATARCGALFSLIVLTLSMLPAGAGASSDDIIRDREAAFRHALEHLEAGRYREALPILRRLNEAYPGGTGVLWNLGQATSRIGGHREALTYWLAFRALEPDHWHVHAKLVQTYEALGDRVARDREREALYALRKAAAPGSELATLDQYVREQFTIAGRRVLVFEFFEPSGSRQVFYSFVVLNEAGTEAFRVSLGSYESTTQFSRASGWVAPGQRVYHLDRYEDDTHGTSHSTYAFFDGTQPSYERVRAMVQDILAGKRPPPRR